MDYNSRKRNTTYGPRYQEGGEIPQEVPQEVDPQQEAIQLLQMFQQLSPEAQQLVIQQLTQG